MPDDAVLEALAANKRLAASRLLRKEELETELRKLQKAGPSDAVAARIQSVSLELASVTEEYQAALNEIAALKKLARTPGAATIPDDPLAPSPEEIALENARSHIADLDALARVGGAPAEASPPPPPPSREDADAKARAAFEELRKKRETPEGGGGAAPPTPKKTF